MSGIEAWLKSVFAAIDSFSVKKLEIGTDILPIITSISDKLFNGVNINDLEPPKWRVLVFLQFSAALHISRVNCAKMADLDNLHVKFLALNVHF